MEKNSAYKNYNEVTVTLQAGKTCNIPSNTYVVFLDNDRTMSEMSNQELTNVVTALQQKVDNMYPVGSIYMTMDNVNPADVFGGTWERLEDGRMLKNTTEANNSGKTGGHNSVTLAANQIPTISTSGTAASAGAHTHDVSGNTGWISADHTHTYSGTTGWMNQNWSHSHTGGNFQPLTGGSNSGYDLDLGATFAAGGQHMGAKNRSTLAVNATDTNHTHNFSGTTSGVSSNHYHYFAATSTSNGAHTHNVSTTYTNNDQQTVSVQNKYVTVYMWKRTA